MPVVKRKTRIAFVAAFASTGALAIAACVGDNPAALDIPLTPDAGGTDTSVAPDVAALSGDGSLEGAVDLDAGARVDATIAADAADAADASDASDAADGAPARMDAGDASFEAGPVDDGGPLAWYGPGLTSDGGVVWPDTSGRGHDLTPLGVAPTVAVAAGQIVAKFTAPAVPAVSCLRNAGLVVPAARSMYAVGLLTRYTNGTVNFDSTLLGFGGKEGGFATIVRAGPSPRWISGNVEFGYNGSAIGDINVVKVFAVRDNGSSALELAITGNSNGPVVGTYLGSATTGGVYVGCDPNNYLNQWDGIVAEVMIFGRRLDDAEHQATINALRTKWSVP